MDRWLHQRFCCFFQLLHGFGSFRQRLQAVTLGHCSDLQGVVRARDHDDAVSDLCCCLAGGGGDARQKGENEK